MEAEVVEKIGETINANIYYIEFLPLFLLGIFCGVARFARHENETMNEEVDEIKVKQKRKTRLLRAIDVILTSGFICVTTYMCLNYFTELDYMVKVGIAGAVALYGVDRILDWLRKIRGIQQGKTD